MQNASAFQSTVFMHDGRQAIPKSCPAIADLGLWLYMGNFTSTTRLALGLGTKVGQMHDIIAVRSEHKCLSGDTDPCPTHREPWPSARCIAVRQYPQDGPWSIRCLQGSVILPCWMTLPAECGHPQACLPSSACNNSWNQRGA